jgi:hypothetical protein
MPDHEWTPADGGTMPDHEWTPAIGLRDATLSLLWRTGLAAALWVGALWLFHAILGGIGVTRVPMIICGLFSAAGGSIAGITLSRGLDERAGFVSPAVAVIGGEALFARYLPVATAHLRFVIVGLAMIVACGWIAKNTLIDS